MEKLRAQLQALRDEMNAQTMGFTEDTAAHHDGMIAGLDLAIEKLDETMQAEADLALANRGAE